MATKRRAVKSSSKARAREQSTSRVKHRTQTDDPIIIKPGNSLVIEIDKNFRDAHNPGNPKKKGHKHPDATRVTWVRIFDEDGALLHEYEVTDETAYVQVCYENPVNGCECPE
jgi:hypothetical protein